METPMKAMEASEKVTPEQWATTSIKDRITLMKKVRGNLKAHAEELARAEAEMKNRLMGEEYYNVDESKATTVIPVANTLSAAIDLYEALAKGKRPEPLGVEEINSNLFKIHVYPRSVKDKLMAYTQKAYLYVQCEQERQGTRGEQGKQEKRRVPKQTDPMDKPTGVIGVLGAGNFSSPLEVVKALVLDNSVVIHKPHPLNAKIDKIWEKIFAPLMDAGAVAFCDADQGEALVNLPKLSKIYFTGGSSTAMAIQSTTKTPVISECGGNNPCLIVPGIRPWTAKEIEHQAILIASAAKVNGGAVCGRPQTIVTSKQWPQREEFLTALKKALETDTPAGGTYYPGSNDVWEGFAKAHSDAEIIEPEFGRYKSGQFMLITDVQEDGHAVKHEAFCQIMGEVSLDISVDPSFPVDQSNSPDPNDPEVFLSEAVKFCNEKLSGTLGAAILMDEQTMKRYRKQLDQAIIDLHYGAVTVNNMPAIVFLNPYLTWGGNETRPGQPFVSGQGNFGNLLGYENIEKSVIVDRFMSPGHFLNTNKAAFQSLAAGMASYAIEPTWKNIAGLMFGVMTAGLKK